MLSPGLLTEPACAATRRRVTAASTDRAFSPPPPPHPSHAWRCREPPVAGDAHRGGSRSREAGMLPTPPAPNAQRSGNAGAARRSRTGEHADSGRPSGGLQLQTRGWMRGSAGKQRARSGPSGLRCPRAPQRFSQPSFPSLLAPPWRARTSYRVGVEGRQRGARGARGTTARVQGGRRLPEQRRVRLQSQLQVEDVVDDVLQDLHFADPLVGRDGGHQPPQPAVTVIHIALQTQGRRLLAPFAAAVLGQAPQRRMPAAAAARPGGLRPAPGVPDGAHGFHGAAGTERDRDLPRHLLPRPRARAARPPPRNASGARPRPLAAH